MVNIITKYNPFLLSGHCSRWQQDNPTWYSDGRWQVCVCVCIHVCVWGRGCLCMCTCVFYCVFICVCVCGCLSDFVGVCVRVHVYVCECVCGVLCIYGNLVCRFSLLTPVWSWERHTVQTSAALTSGSWPLIGATIRFSSLVIWVRETLNLAC